ncbi:MAG: phosphatidylglycerol lysyltransferase domain-containing protein, partial [bacterium]
DLINLRGKKYDGKRNHLKKFKKKYSYNYCKLTPVHINGCLEVLDRWYSQHCEHWECSLSLLNEIAACRQALENYQLLGLKGGIIEVDKKIVAFSLGEKLNKNTAVIHFEKVDEDYQELAAVINQEYAAAECGNYQYINREEDLGEPGLRASKLSYHPAYLVDKYYIVF